MKLAGRGLAVLAAIAVMSTACGGDDGGDEPAADDSTSEPTEEVPCAEADAPECTPPTPPQDRGPKFYRSQSIGWTDCGVYECGTIEVPIDYDDPSGSTLTLSLKRAPSTSGDPIGTLFINPGGPGGSGTGYVETLASEMSDEVRDSYDIVGFDPRGVASSDPLECLDDAELDELVSYDPDPDTSAEAERARELVRGLGEACAGAGSLAENVSTVDVARDLEVLRAVVGDDKLHYYGASYGTYIGAVYAELYPDRVGRLVLDGALDPTLSAQEQNIQQAAGFQTALEAYVDDCLASDGCPLEGDRDDALRQISDFLEQLDESPLDTGDSDRPLTEALGFYGIALPLYREDYWPLLTQGLTAAFEGDGAMLLSFADTYLSRTPSGYSDNSAQVIYAVNCLDRPVQMTDEQIRQSERRYEQASSVFGRTFAWSMLGCAEWPIRPERPAPKIDAAGAAPIVVVGTTRDPATPYHWAQALANQLDSGVLVTRDGDGHTGYHMGNECVDDALDSYLADGTVPEDGLSC